MIRIELTKRGKVIVSAAIIICFAAVGAVIDRHERDNFIVETITEDGESYYPVGERHEIDGKININAADAEELELLPGIGESLASRIIRYREENGPFESTEDIMAVSGISENKFEDMKDIICVEGKDI